MNKHKENTKKYFFFGGMQRTGATLLASILNQNPDIHFGPASPVCQLMWDAQSFFQNDSLYLDYPKPKFSSKMTKDIIKQYYADRKEPYIIDKCITWGTEPNIEMIKKYITTNIKMICTIRPALEILTSFGSLRQSNGKTTNYDDYANLLNHPYSSVANLKTEKNKKYALFVTYNDIVSNIEKVIKDIYTFLEIPFFEHSFDNIKNEFKSHNELLEKNLHTVRPTIKDTSKDPHDILPEHIIRKYKGMYPLLENK